MKSMPHEKNPKQKVEELNKFPLLLSVRSGAAVSMVRPTALENIDCLLWIID